MTKHEFTQNLRKALSGRVNYRVVNENVAYYESYIDGEIRKGRSEEEVLESLGDPRLIARTIIETAGEEDMGSEEENREEKREKRIWFGRIPSWVMLILAILIFAVVLKLVGVVLSLVLPVLLPLMLIFLLYKMFWKR